MKLSNLVRLPLALSPIFIAYCPFAASVISRSVAVRIDMGFILILKPQYSATTVSGLLLYNASVSALPPSFLSAYIFPFTLISNASGSAGLLACKCIKSSDTLSINSSCLRISSGKSLRILSCNSYKFFLYCPSNTRSLAISASTSIFRFIFGFAAVIAFISA